ncbi:MAG: hypothetical protein A2Y38_13310 [Spirochaetes bacterium GWB1_59_5]|nr:MAG: hypothetical protein A2Y38_13310 [Spirochaetes bacterium GWB1_59_5]
MGLVTASGQAYRRVADTLAGQQYGVGWWPINTPGIRWNMIHNWQQSGQSYHSGPSDVGSWGNPRRTDPWASAEMRRLAGVIFSGEIWKVRYLFWPTFCWYDADTRARTHARYGPHWPMIADPYGGGVHNGDRIGSSSWQAYQNELADQNRRAMNWLFQKRPVEQGPYLLPVYQPQNWNGYSTLLDLLDAQLSGKGYTWTRSWISAGMPMVGPLNPWEAQAVAAITDAGLKARAWSALVAAEKDRQSELPPMVVCASREEALEWAREVLR